MFSVKLVARPDARMVEVPLDIEAELPREFDGAALLASSGLPRRVRLKATKDALRLSTAYRADQLVADIVKSALRANAVDVERVQDAVMKFIRAVRERRQDGATLVVSGNGRGMIEWAEQMPSSRPPAPATPAPQAARVAPSDRAMSLERRIAELEATIAEKLAALEQKLVATDALLARMQAAGQVAGPGMERTTRPVAQGASGARRATAIEAYAEGLRAELAARASAASARARTDVERCDRAAALVADAEVLGVEPDGTSRRLRDASAQAAARQTALERLAQEIEFYAGADLPVAAQLLARLEDTALPDPAPSLEGIAQAVARAAKGTDQEARASWMQRAAALCAWQLVEPKRGDAVDPQWHEPVDSGGPSITAVACPGARRGDGTPIVRARIGTVATPEMSAPAPDAAPAAVVPAPAPAVAAPPPAAAVPAESAAPALPATAATGAAVASPAAPAPDPPPLNPPGETPILPQEAAAAAASASLVPKVVTNGDPATDDEALAVEVALSMLKPVSSNPVSPKGEHLDEVHPLADPPRDDAGPKE